MGNKTCLLNKSKTDNINNKLIFQILNEEIEANSEIEKQIFER